tara:strand:- start:166 stop:486 length:321 start_codon:yes stop_codon:yes gene_type:complete
MSQIIDILGLSGSILVSVSFLPQTYKTIMTDDIKDISLLFMLLNVISASLMCIYGIYYNIVPILISNGSVLINCLIILIFMQRTTNIDVKNENTNILTLSPSKREI